MIMMREMLLQIMMLNFYIGKIEKKKELNLNLTFCTKKKKSFPLTYPRPELSYDGQHYVLSEDTQQDWVYMEQTQHLINELCQGVLW